MHVTIHGVGYVGLVTGACLAEAGNHVMCFDINPARIQSLQQCQSPIHEPGLEELLIKNVAAGRLSFTTDVAEAVDHAEVQFIAVATPAQENGEADLGYVLSVARNIATHMQSYKLIVNKSTVPVNAAEIVRQAVRDITSFSFDVASNPEFLKEGMAVEDFMHPYRVVVGADSDRAATCLKKLYEPFIESPDQILCMDLKSAELSKYTSNAMLAARISFMNEMSRLAEALGADIESIRVAMGMDPRIGPFFLHPGPGYGGSCFPKDMKALIHMGKTIGVQTPLLSAVETVNASQKRLMFEKIDKYFCGEWKDKNIAVWGLSFKANTDDVRDSASLVLINLMLAQGAQVVAYDPLATVAYITQVSSPDAALKGADALVIMTDPDMFKSVNFISLKALMKSPVIFDARNMYDLMDMSQLGISYFSIGRAAQVKHQENQYETHS